MVWSIAYITEYALDFELDEDNIITRISVWPLFHPQIETPPMDEAIGVSVETEQPPTELPLFIFEGKEYEVIDAHLHTGITESQTPTGMSYLINQVPPFS